MRLALRLFRGELFLFSLQNQGCKENAQNDIHCGVDPVGGFGFADDAVQKGDQRRGGIIHGVEKERHDQFLAAYVV